jgi:hypothetical protein
LRSRPAIVTTPNPHNDSVKLHSPDAAEGTGAVPSDPSPSQTTPAPAEPPAAPPASAPPPAAATVVSGEITEETLRLRTMLENERGRADHAESTRIEREKRINQLEDQLETLRKAQQLTKVKKIGVTFFS